MKSLSPAVLARPDPSELHPAAHPRPARAACVVWLTGLSGAGKSTLAKGLRARMVHCGLPVAVLDGDTVRQGLSRGLGFSEEDRCENVRRIAEVARLLSAQGVLVVVATISPRQAQRALARQIVSAAYREVHVDAPVGLCEQRDVKGLYARVRRGEIAQFTGVSDPYEAPAAPDLRIDTAALGIADAVQKLTVALVGRWMAASQPMAPQAELVR
ncbi:MAG: adenylyl-sulfate kinase [Pseudacidovorax sp.]|nr:adenylyl-sulfate kinase [Pseudacidovorax sp.]